MPRKQTKLTLFEAAEALDLSYGALAKHVQRGNLASELVSVTGKRTCRMVKADDLEAFISTYRKRGRLNSVTRGK